MKPYRALVLGLAMLLPLVAGAQWQWIDKDGRKVFSDRPPPTDLPAKNILKQPAPMKKVESDATPKGTSQEAGNAPGGVSPESAAVPKQPAGNIPKVTGHDKDLEKKKSQAEAIAAAKATAEDAKNAKTRADNCQRAMRSKASFESGARIARTGANGEREFLGEAARAVEVKRLDEIIRKDCAGAL